MTLITTAFRLARRFAIEAPREAATDAAGCVAIFVLIFGGLTLPALF